MHDYVRICRPAFFSSNISEYNLFFDLLQGSLRSSERAEEYGERYWRMVGEHHTLICFDAGDCWILEKVEECHHDDSILDELFAAASILSHAGLKVKQEFYERCGAEKLREFIKRNVDHFVGIFEEGPERNNNPLRAIRNSPAPVLAELLRVMVETEHVRAVVSSLGTTRILAALGCDAGLRRMLLPYLA